jgi:serine/threonine-protein kinase RsbW
MSMEERLEVDIRVPNQTRYLGLIGKIGEDIARTLKHYEGDREELAYHINLVLTEAMTNAIRHANEDNPNKDLQITIQIEKRQLQIRVYDEGEGFDFAAVSAPEFKYLDEHGRGVYIIRSLMDSVTYKRNKKGHVLEMVKSLN